MNINRLPEAAIALHQLAAQLVEKAAFDIQATAVAKAPFQTGYLKSSIFVHTWTKSTYGQNLAGGGPGAYLLPDTSKPPNDMTAFIGVGANYGIYQEFGTSRMAAHPYLTPACDEVRPSFEQSFSALEARFRALGVF